MKHCCYTKSKIAIWKPPSVPQSVSTRKYTTKCRSTLTMSSKIATREIREHRQSLLTNAMKDRNSWREPPPFFIIHPDDKERIPIRNANHEAYQVLGTTAIWNKYIDLGYYMFDDCMQFHKVWKSTAKDSITQRNKIIWQSYHFHRMHDIPIPPKLNLSATSTARSYLKEKEPDFILATDIEHEEKEFFAACNPPNKDTNTTNSDDSDEDANAWTEVITKKTRKKTPPTSPTNTPKQSPPIMFESMIPSEDIMTDLKQARITPVPQFTPERKQTRNKNDDNPDYPVNNIQEDIQTINNPININTPQSPPNAKLNKCIATNDSSKRSHDKLSTDKHDKATKSNQTNTHNNIHFHHDDNIHEVTPTSQIPDIDTQMTTDADANNGDQTINSADYTKNSTHTADNEHFSTASQHTSRDFVSVNDGTLRITIKWKPINYAAVTQDEEQWNEHAIQMLSAILNPPSVQLQLAQWSKTITDNSTLIQADLLTVNNLHLYRSPKISNLDSYKTSIFGIRISANDKSFSIGTWLTSPVIKAAIERHNIELKVSNSTCDSGTMVTAGSILLKHPKYTQRMYFMMALRRQLPTNAPYFDIVVHRRTLNGIDSPHLVVQCGANHQVILSEMLSSLMDGIKTTALYVGTQYLQSLTQEALEDLYDLHQKYVNSIQRLPLSPYVLNVDRIREEHSNTGDIRRTTRAWANSITNPAGISIQCDAENGGRDKKAYLLVPDHLLDIARLEMNRYLHNIRNWHIQPNQSSGSDNHDTDRPREIYVPTAAVQRNIDFLHSMASSDIWKNAPSTIRQSKATTNSTQASEPTTTKIHPTTPLRQNNQTQPTRTPQSDNLSANRQTHPTRNSAPFVRHLDDNTITTANSNTTTINSSFAAKFTEIENAIKTSQADFQQLNSRFDQMENQILNTMTSCHENSKHMLSMQNQMNSMQSNVQDIANQMKLLTTHLKVTPTPGNAENSNSNHLSNEIQSPEKKKSRQMEPEATSIVSVRPMNLNINKYNQDNHRSTNQHNIQADQLEDQYQDNSFPGSAMDE